MASVDRRPVQDMFDLETVEMALRYSRLSSGRHLDTTKRCLDPRAIGTTLAPKAWATPRPP